MQLGEPRLLEPDEFLVADAGLSRAPIGWNVLLAPGAHAGAEFVEVGRHAYNPVETGSTRPAGQLVAGRGQPEGQPAQRLAVSGQPGQGGLVAESDGAVQLMTHPEDDLGRLDRRHPQRERVVKCFRLAGADAPQRVLGEDLQPAAFDFRVGQLELHTLERRQRLAELLAQAHVRDGQLDGAVEHAEQRPARQHERKRHITRPVPVGFGQLERCDECGPGGTVTDDRAP